MRLATLGILAALLLAGEQKAGDEPGRKGPDEKTPAQRRLRGEDAKKAKKLSDRAESLLDKDQLDDALAILRELIDLRGKLQGDDHWETQDAKRRQVVIEKVKSLPAADAEDFKAARRARAQSKLTFNEGRYVDAVAAARRALDGYRRHLGAEHAHTLEALSDLAVFLDLAGGRAEALPLHQEAAAACRKQLGDDNPITAACLASYAFHLRLVGRRDEEERMLRQALAIQLRLAGEEDGAAGTITNNLGALLYEQGRLSEAEPLFRKGLEVRRRVLGPDHPDVGQSLGNLGVLLGHQGKHAESEPVLREAVELWRRARGDQHPETANTLLSYANSVAVQGRYAEANPLFEQALAVTRKSLGEEHEQTAACYDFLGRNLKWQGKVAEAEPLHRKALEINRKVLGERHRATATSLNNVGHTLLMQNKDAEAEHVFRQALIVYERAFPPGHAGRAVPYLNIANALHAQGKYAEATTHFAMALDIQRQANGEDHPETSQFRLPLARELWRQARYAEAEAQYRQTLAVMVRTLGEPHKHVVMARISLAQTLRAAGKGTEAGVELTLACQGFDVARLRSSRAGLERAQFSTGSSPLPYLAALLAGAGRSLEAWQRLEANLARGLLDEFSTRAARALTPDERRRQDEGLRQLDLLDRQSAALLARKQPGEKERQRLDELALQRTTLQGELAALEADLVQREVFQLERIRKQLPADAALIAWLDLAEVGKSGASGEHWACIVRPAGPPRWVRLPGSGPGDAWTDEDDSVLLDLRDELVAGPRAGSRMQDLLRRAHAQRLAPVEAVLRKEGGEPVRRLIILPAGRMNLVPAEVLTDRYVFSYAPSATVFARLREQGRRPVTDGPHLLALADPTFVKRENGARPLPGTRREVEAIAHLFGKTEMLLGTDATAARLEKLADSDRLRAFRVLHLATHGASDSAVALQSALILAPDQGAKDNGLLTAEQMLRTWKLDADLVTLSACQSALGKHGGSEGQLGFIQALLLVNARSLLLSQWQVSDTATALLMVRFYENWLGKRPGLDKPMSKAAALLEAKHWLRNLPRKEVEERIASLPEAARGLKLEPSAESQPPKTEKPYEHPYYWSAFILIGDPN